MLRLLLLIMACFSQAVCAQFMRVEIHPVASVTMSDQDFLNGRKDGKPVTLAGELRIRARAPSACRR